MSHADSTYMVKPGAEVDLKRIDPGDRGKDRAHKDADQEMRKLLEKMDLLQYRMYAEHKHSLLIVLQGLDAAGKDGVIRHVLAGMNPQGCTVTGFKQPTPEQLDHDFLWRVHPHVPTKGGVAIFNRSHYEDVLVARVHRQQPLAETARRYGLINDFEKLLVQENNTTILKFFLHISKDEQLSRFKKRIDDPSHHWKISESDYVEREYWDEYLQAYAELLQHTSTGYGRWFVIPSDHKWFRNLTVSQIITNEMEELNIHTPQSKVDIDDIRRKYHEAAERSKVARKNTDTD